MAPRHNDIIQWIENASPADEIFLHLKMSDQRGTSSLDPKIAFQEHANKDAAFAHTYEILKRASDAKLVKLRYSGQCLFVTRLARELLTDPKS